MEVARDLQAFLARDLMLHIAKEEEVLFPPLEALAHELEDAVVHAVAQHDEIRVRRDLIDRTMAALDAHHDEIEEERAGFVARVRSGLAAPSSQWLAELQERAMRIERILLGHFAEEEEDLFVPAATLLSPEVLKQLAEQMAALERAAPRSGASSGAGEGW